MVGDLVATFRVNDTPNIIVLVGHMKLDSV